MAQVIEVRLVNPVSGESLCDRFTQASSHREAVEVALNAWSGGVGVMKGMNKFEGFEQGKWDGSGPCFIYKYIVTLEDDEYDREVAALLFAQYKEKEG